VAAFQEEKIEQHLSCDRVDGLLCDQVDGLLRNQVDGLLRTQVEGLLYRPLYLMQGSPWLFDG
jgi:hypothetical protein